MSVDLVVRGRQVVFPDGSRPASIHIRGGVIASIEPFETIANNVEVIDAGEVAVMPGLVDTHVHLNDPGRSHWEGFETGTRAAAAGGITTLVDMPLNSIPATTDVNGFRVKREAAAERCWVDVGFWGGVVPGNADQIEPLLAEGVLGFKCFLVPSGVDEFLFVTAADLKRAAPVLAANQAVLLAHAELPELLAAPNGDRHSYSTYLASRPRAAENQAIRGLIELSRQFGTAVHIVHLSSSDALELLSEARHARLPVTVETCPHYLTFCSEEIPDGANECKCAPPIRERENREKLWQALSEGAIDLIATDHSPCPPDLKAGDFFSAWGGIASLQFSLSAVWTEACRRGYSLSQVSRWMSHAPARLAGLEGRKGSIQEGKDADLIFFDPRRPTLVEEPIYHRHPTTPYRHRTLLGQVERTILRGHTVYCRGQFAQEPAGQLLLGRLSAVNAAAPEQAREAFLRCCGSHAWSAGMTRSRPFGSLREMFTRADAIWQALSESDWREAFQAHPRIGQRSASAWSTEEQSGMIRANHSVQDELRRLNDQYFDRFGFIFIICATGKTSEQMLESLKSRLTNDRPTELRQAAEQQRLITHIRLRKLIAP